MSILNGKRVLIVEDEILIALDTLDELVSAGCKVVGPVPRLEEALALAHDEPLDAAVIDVNLNGTLVWPLAELLDERKVPFVLLTGFGAALDIPDFCRTALRLAKPVPAGALPQFLTTMLKS